MPDLSPRDGHLAATRPNLGRIVGLDPNDDRGACPEHVPNAVLHWAARVEARLMGRKLPTGPAVAANRAAMEAAMLGRRRAMGCDKAVGRG